MKNLVIFGCEYSNNEYLKVNFGKSWVEYFSKYIHLENIENFSIVDTSNDVICELILKYINNNKIRDTHFLICWADPFRKEYSIEGKKYIITDNIDLNKKYLSDIYDSEILLSYLDKYGFLNKSTFLMNSYNSIISIQSLFEAFRIPYLFFNSVSNLNQRTVPEILRYRNLINRKRYLKISFQEFIESESNQNSNKQEIWADYIFQKLNF